MGLLDKIKKKKETEQKTEPPKGKQLTVSSEEEFLETCKDLTQDFQGIMLLSGEIEGEKYSASLLLDKGNIIGSTFEYKGLITFREQAIDDIRGKLKGSKGILHIFEFTQDDMGAVIEANKTAVLASPVQLSSLGLKIKMLIDEWAKSCEEGGGKARTPDFFKKKNFNLLELARSPEAAQQAKEGEGQPEIEVDESKIPGLGNLMPGAADPKLEKLRKIKEERQKKIQEKLMLKAKKKDSEQKDSTDGEKIQTTIDRLYSLVKKYRKLRIDEKLSRSLGVNRAQIEEWAVILEEHDLIELRYPTIGEPEILIKES